MGRKARQDLTLFNPMAQFERPRCRALLPGALKCLLAASLLVGLSLAHSQASDTAVAASAADAERLHLDVREQILRVPVEVQDAFGKPSKGELLVTTFRPAGPGPFPLVLISHGRSTDKRAEYKRPRFETAARYFVRKGFAVAVPLRLGYGELAEAGDPESSISCREPRFAPALAAAASQILAVAAHMQQQPDIDAKRVVLLGQSVGGISTMAATAAGLPGQVAAINFAGGHGGDPDKHPGEPCGGTQLRQIYQAYGELIAQNSPQLRSLWVYAENDRYFGPRFSRSWAKAFAEAGAALDYRLFPAFGEDGHTLFSAGSDSWQPLVEEFLAQLGFSTPGVIAVPPFNAELDVQDESALPLSGSGAKESYRKFLAVKKPRAFAFNAQGRTGYAFGDAAVARALAFCQRYSSQTCQLYAVDDAVVWSRKKQQP